MKTPVNSSRLVTFISRHLNSTWRLTLIATIVFSAALIFGYAATASASLGLHRFAISREMTQTKQTRVTPIVDRLLRHAESRDPLSLRFGFVMEPIIYTDRINYFPGDWAHISGFGFAPYETVTLQVVHTNGTAEGGMGHEPWSVYADADGNFTSDWYVNPDDSAGARFLLTAIGNTSGLTAESAFADGLADIDTCANGTAGAPVQCTGGNWDNGNLNASKSHYFEGDSVPYRARFDGLIPGNTYTVTIGYDTTKGGKHAFDYLTSFDRTEPQPGNNPCTLKQGGSVVSICDPSIFTTVAIPTDPNVTNGQDGVPSGDDISQIPGVFTLYNGALLTVVGGYTVDGTYAGDSTTKITVQFQATDSQVVLAWAGHISTRLNWGLANSAISISGSPYHMRFEAMTCPEGCNVGQQDHQLSATAVFFPVQLTIVKETNPDSAPSHTFSYTTTGTDVAAFNLTPPNGTTSVNQVFNLKDATTRTVTETDPAPDFSFTSLTCSSVTGGAGTSTPSISDRTVTINPVEGEFITCTYVNTEQPKLTVTKKILGGNGTTDSFDVKVDGTTKIDNAVSTDPAGTSVGPFVSTAGNHTVSETFGDGTTAVSSDWTVTFSGDCNSSGVVTLAAGESKQCTVTNEKKPKLTVTKKIIGGNGTTDSFDVKVDGTTKIDDAISTAAAGTSAGPFASTVGNHTVSETFGDGTTAVSSDWNVTFSGDCDSGGNVTLAAGDSKQCTITNEKKPKLTVTKKIIGGNGTTDSFDVKVDGTTKIDNAVSTAAAGTSAGPFAVTVGNHTVSETFGDGTTAVSSDWIVTFSGDCDSNGLVTVAAGDSKQCTITNEKKPKLTVTKKIIGGNGTTDSFDVKVDGTTKIDDAVSTAAAGTSFGPFASTVGNHTVSETFGDGTTAVSSDWIVTFSGDCDSNGLVTLAAGDSKQCTITNEKKPKLTVTKKIIGGNGTTDSFDVKVDGVTKIDDAVSTAAAGTSAGPFNSTAGNHTVSETFGDGTTAVSSDWIVTFSGDCDSNGLVTLAAGDSKQCTITNEKKPKLTVTKKIIGGNGTTDSFDVKVDGTTKIDDAVSTAAAGTSAGPFNSTAGNHTVSETFGDGTTAVSSDWIVTFSGDCDSNGLVTLAAGDSKQCTITNEKKPKLTVTKKIIGGNGTTDSFDVKVDGVTKIDNAVSTAAAGTSAGPFNSTVGNHTVSETFGDGTTAVSSDWIVTFSGDCDSNGLVTLAAGDSKQCTITNEKKPKLTVTKKIIGGNGTTDSFDVKVDGTTKIDDAVSTAAAGTSAGPFASTAGNHTVSETFGDGTTAVSSDWIVTFSGNCDSSGNVTLAAGDSKQCTITNEKKPKLTVTKKIVGGNGTTDSFDVKVDGTTKIDNAVSTAAAGTSAGPFNSTVGNHTVSETFGDGTTAVSSDWIVTFSGDCNSSGVVTLAAGDSKQCTITNTKKGMAQVIKTFNGGALGANSFTFQLRSGASAGAAGTILESGTANAGNNGTINFATKLTPGTTYQMCEQMQPGWLTTLGPPLYSVFNPSGDNSVVCTDFTVTPGETKVFTINNQPPPGGMGLTIGFWKNWASCANSNGGQKPTLDRTLQLGDLTLGSLVLHDSNSNLNVASDCQQVVNLLNKTTITGGKKMSSDPIFNMVAQLVAADLNVLAGAGQSVNAMNARSCAHALLVAINFNGNTYNKPLSAAQTNQANCLATQLDRYNNNLSVGTCAGCP